MLTRAVMEDGRKPWNLTVGCAGCGADLSVEPDRRFIDCPYCGAASVLDLGVAATCSVLRSALDEEEAKARLGSWAKDHGVDFGEIEDLILSKLFIPFWVLGTEAGDSSILAAEEAFLPLPSSGRRPAGQLEALDADHFGTHDLVDATVPLSAALGRLGFPPEGEQEARASLVYVPYFRAEYSCSGMSHDALVDAATGAVHAMTWPQVRRGGLEGRLAALVALAIAGYVAAAALAPGALLTFGAYAVLTCALFPLLGKTIHSMEARR